MLNLISKDVLRAYIREMDQEGLLDESPVVTAAQVSHPQSITSQAQPSTHSTSGDYPPTFNSLSVASGNPGAKEMVVHEDNMKFPPYMKLERPKPESRGDGANRDSQSNL